MLPNAAKCWENAGKFFPDDVSGINNIKTDALSRKVELQGNKKPLGAILRLNKDRKVRYNHPQLAGTYKALRSL